MCLLFACKDIPLPKIYDSADDEADWWAWKDLLQSKKQAYNGRLVKGKATLMSMDVLAAAYSAYLTTGGYAMYEEEYYWGKLGRLANQVAEYLDRNGPTPVDVLRRAVVPDGKENTRRFHSALLELQSRFKIVSVGLEDRGWGIRVLDLFTNWIPANIEARAENMPKEDAIRRLLAVFVDAAGAIPETQLLRTFRLPPSDIAEAVETLVLTGGFVRRRARGDRRSWLSSPKL